MWMSAIEAPLLLWSYLGCCMAVILLQHASSHLTCRYTCFGVICKVESARALELSLVPPPHSAVCSCGGRCEHCMNINFGHRRDCNRCKALKPA